MKMSWLFPVVISLLVSACNNEPVDNTVITNGNFKIIIDSITNNINRKIIPSFSVAVSQKGKVIWMQSFGWADKENNIKATPETPYALGSLSKSITSTALMVLAEKGLVRLSDPVDPYLGKAKLTYYRGKPGQLTVNQLTNMMAGIPHQYEYYYTAEGKAKLSMEEQIQHYGIVVFPPGQVFNYSNFSPAVAEQIIKNSSRQEFPQFMQQKVFGPLKMKNASITLNGFAGIRVAKGYDDQGKLLEESEFYPRGGAGYFASVADLLVFGMFHLKDPLADIQPILSHESIDQLHKSNELPGYNPFYSNGWGVLKIGENHTSLLSNGAIDGTASSLLLLPEQDIAIACLTNASMGNDYTDQIAFRIANTLVPGYFDELKLFIEANAPAFSDRPFLTKDSLIGIWNGMIMTYQDSIPVKLVFNKNGQVLVQIRDQFETLMNNMTVNNGLIRGQSYGNISLPETAGIPHYLEFVLKHQKNEIYGCVSAQSFHTKRPYFLIPAYIELKKRKY
jgi:CubicO group peptidase (beta-lactamase class C family)